MAKKKIHRFRSYLLYLLWHPNKERKKKYVKLVNSFLLPLLTTASTAAVRAVGECGDGVLQLSLTFQSPLTSMILVLVQFHFVVLASSGRSHFTVRAARTMDTGVIHAIMHTHTHRQTIRHYIIHRHNVINTLSSVKSKRPT